MASEREQAATQAEIVINAQGTSTRNSLVPTWFWLVSGLVLAFAIYATTTSNVVMYFVALFAVTGGVRGMAVAVRRFRGIDVFSRISSAGVLVMPFVVVVGGLFILAGAGARWPHGVWVVVVASVLAALVSLAFGAAVNRISATRTGA
jgi:hypothetical protein